MDFRRIGLGMKKGISNQCDIARKFTLKGFCECKGICIQMKDTVADFSHCHCSQCLKILGHFAAYTSAVKEQIEWQNQETLCWFDSSEKARRGFCGKYGASLFYELKGGAGLSITAGSIESPTGLHAAGHIYFENHTDY